MLNEGMYLSDRYEVVGKVGAGGMSDVYKAKDHILGRFVAIKVLKAEFSEDMNFVTKFRTEAQSAAALEHPNIVNIYDVGSENGMHFIVMEYVEGITLKTYIEKKQQLSFKESVSIAIQVARGIEAAHSKNIIHRDIKPQNIIISTEGKVKVTDFGIARAASSNTISSDVMGSVHYASPEQARNGFVDGRSDIYSLGIMMYEMVTGRVPFDGDTTVAVAIQHLQEEMVSPKTYASDLPISMEKIILKCTQKNPDRRYQNIGDLLMDLRKSLVDPDSDFVVIAPAAVDANKTKIINEEELEKIKEEAPMDEKTKDADTDVDTDEDDEDDEEGFLSPKMEKVMTIGGIVVAIILVIVIIFLIGSIAGLFHFGKTETKPTESQVTESETSTEDLEEMIDLSGKTVEEAEAALKEAGLDQVTVFVYAYEANDQYTEGQIVSQDPEAGKEIAKDGKVNVTVCGEVKDENAVIVPDVKTLTEDAAINTLNGVGLKYEKEYVPSDEVESGKVIAQSPEAGSQSTKRSTVKISVSSGAAPVQVPNVEGLDQETAKSNIEAAGLAVTITEEENDLDKGKVISQSPASGKEVQKGSTVELKVSKGPKASTYKFSYTSGAAPAGTVSVSYVLKDANGSELANVATKAANPGDQITINASNIETSKGTLVVTWNVETKGEEDTEAQKSTVTEYDGTISFDKEN